MRSALLSQAEIHALLYSGYNELAEFDMSYKEPVGVVPGKPFGLSSDVSPYLDSSSFEVGDSSDLYFPLDPMVINCADPVMNRFAEVGITFQMRDAKCAEDVKKILPTLRSAILVTLSQKTSEELLSRLGKEKLASDILLEIGRVFGGSSLQALSGKVGSRSPKNPDVNPVVEVLFSSLIVH
jgi:flagellar basal body-associated protein FliL